MAKKHKNILLIIYVLTLFAACIGATLAYFTAIQSSTVSPSTKVQTATMSSAAFITGKPIYIYATPNNFGVDMGNLKDSSYSVASLKAADNEAITYKYKVYLNIKNNDFVYSTTENYPEIILKITGPGDVEITSVDGLDYIEGMGFDITNKVGEYIIDDSYEISTDSFIEQYWNYEVTLVNLGVIQNINMGRSVDGIITLEPII